MNEIPKFDVVSWRRKKYGDKEPQFLPLKEYRHKIKGIEKRINNMIKSEGRKRGIVGVIVIGGYARGEVHEDSDFDFACLTDQPLKEWSPRDFIDLLQLEVPLSYLGFTVFTDEAGFRSNIEYFMDEYKIISPYNNVYRIVSGILSKITHFS